MTSERTSEPSGYSRPAGKGRGRGQGRGRARRIEQDNDITRSQQCPSQVHKGPGRCQRPARALYQPGAFRNQKKPDIVLSAKQFDSEGVLNVGTNNTTDTNSAASANVVEEMSGNNLKKKSCLVNVGADNSEQISASKDVLPCNTVKHVDNCGSQNKNSIFPEKVGPTGNSVEKTGASVNKVPLNSGLTAYIHSPDIQSTNPTSMYGQDICVGTSTGVQTNDSTGNGNDNDSDDQDICTSSTPDTGTQTVGSTGNGNGSCNQDIHVGTPDTGAQTVGSTGNGSCNQDIHVGTPDTSAQTVGPTGNGNGSCNQDIHVGTPDIGTQTVGSTGNRNGSCNQNIHVGTPNTGTQTVDSTGNCYGHGDQDICVGAPNIGSTGNVPLISPGIAISGSNIGIHTGDVIGCHSEVNICMSDMQYGSIDHSTATQSLKKETCHPDGNSYSINCISQVDGTTVVKESSLTTDGTTNQIDCSHSFDGTFDKTDSFIKGTKGEPCDSTGEIQTLQIDCLKTTDGVSGFTDTLSPSDDTNDRKDNLCTTDNMVELDSLRTISGTANETDSFTSIDGTTGISGTIGRLEMEILSNVIEPVVTTRTNNGASGSECLVGSQKHYPISVHDEPSLPMSICVDNTSDQQDIVKEKLDDTTVLQSLVEEKLSLNICEQNDKKDGELDIRKITEQMDKSDNIAHVKTALVCPVPKELQRECDKKDCIEQNEMDGSNTLSKSNMPMVEVGVSGEDNGTAKQKSKRQSKKEAKTKKKEEKLKKKSKATNITGLQKDGKVINKCIAGESNIRNNSQQCFEEGEQKVTKSEKKEYNEKQENVEEKKDGEDEDWEANWDDDGECLDSDVLLELRDVVDIKDMKVEKPKYDYLSFKPKDIVLENGIYDHVVEIHDFSPQSKTPDLIHALAKFKTQGFDIKWVDDTHALAVFSNHKIAQQAIEVCSSPMLKLRSIYDGTHESKLKAKRNVDFLQPYKDRPKTSKLIANRLVTGALGVRSKMSKEERQEEREKIKAEREKKLTKEKQKKDLWDNEELEIK